MDNPTWLMSSRPCHQPLANLFHMRIARRCLATVIERTVATNGLYHLCDKLAYLVAMSPSPEPKTWAASIVRWSLAVSSCSLTRPLCYGDELSALTLARGDVVRPGLTFGQSAYSALMQYSPNKRHVGWTSDKGPAQNVH